MTRAVYVNGEFVEENAARVSVFDRGFLFADAVYEVTSVLDGRLVDNAAHLTRLARSLSELSIPAPLTDQELTDIQQQLIRLNKVEEGAVYLQISRGAAERDYAYPDVPPTVVMFTMERKISADPKALTGMRVVTVPDIRWQRRDVKTVGLLPAAMGKNQALAQGVDDAWFVEEGYITEASASNAYIITDDNRIITRQLGSELLPGVTRKSVLNFAKKAGYAVEERPFTPAEAYQAKEAFITSATTYVMPVVEIDGHSIGAGVPGPIVKELRALYIQEARAATI